jgi:hypothetical protein
MRLLEKLSALFYITVDEKYLRVLNVKKNITAEKELTLLPENPFAHRRVLIGDVEMAKDIIADTLKQSLTGVSDQLLKPVIIFHSLRSFEDGVTTFEKQGAVHFLMQMGAGQVFVYEGKVLSKEEVLEFASQKFN